MVGHEALPTHLSVVVDIFETHFEEIIAAYEERLFAIGSPLVTEAQMREQVKAQAHLVLKEVVTDLRGREALSDAQQSEDRLSETIGGSRASDNIHAVHSLRAVVAFSEAALSVVIGNLPPSLTLSSEIATVALALQKSIMNRVMRAALTYGSYLLEKAHESHADERRRISRELHDRVAHSIMVAFRNLELYELYSVKDPSKAQDRLQLAKSTTQEALDLTRSLSRELRSASAEEGLEVALAELLSISVPQEVRSWVSVRGDEAHIAPQVVRDELFLTLRESVRNAVTHSGAKTIKVEVDITESRVKAAVKDDGRGFEPGEEAYRAGGTGLASMKERPALLGGNLSLVSVSGGGTRVEIFLPLPRSQR